MATFTKFTAINPATAKINLNTWLREARRLEIEESERARFFEEVLSRNSTQGEIRAAREALLDKRNNLKQIYRNIEAVKNLVA